MDDILELQEERSHKVRTAKDISEKANKENRHLTDEEQGNIKDLLEEAKKLEARIGDIERSNSIAKQVDDIDKAMRKPEGRRTMPDQPQTTPAEPRNEDAPLPRYGKLKAFKGQDAERRAYRAGQWALATLYGNPNAQRYCRANFGDEYRAHSVGTDANGGHLVPEELTQAIIDNREEYGVFRREVRVQPMASNTLDIPVRKGGLTASFVAESTAGSPTDTTWGQVQLAAKKLYALTYLSSEIAEDAIIDLADYLAEELAYAFAFKEDQVGFNGDGTAGDGSMTGIVTTLTDGNHDGGLVTAATGHDTFEEIDEADIARLMSRLPQWARMNAKFYCSQVAHDLVFSRLALLAGGNTIQTVSGSFRPSYLGHEIVTSQVLNAKSTAQTAGDAMILFGDLRKTVVMGERRGIRIARSNDAKFEEDQIAIRATERFDLEVHSAGDDTTAGGTVGLVAPGA